MRSSLERVDALVVHRASVIWSASSRFPRDRRYLDAVPLILSHNRHNYSKYSNMSEFHSNACVNLYCKFRRVIFQNKLRYFLFLVIIEVTAARPRFHVPEPSRPHHVTITPAGREAGRHALLLEISFR